jgi:hypothetical protein
MQALRIEDVRSGQVLELAVLLKCVWREGALAAFTGRRRRELVGANWTGTSTFFRSGRD